MAHSVRSTDKGSVQRCRKGQREQQGKQSPPPTPAQPAGAEGNCAGKPFALQLKRQGVTVTGTQSSCSHRRGSQRGCGLQSRKRATPTSSGPSRGSWRTNTSTPSAACCLLAGVPCGLNRTGSRRAKEPPRAQSGVERGPQEQVSHTLTHPRPDSMGRILHQEEMDCTGHPARLHPPVSRLSR